MQNAIHMLPSLTDSQINSFIITTRSKKIIAIDGGMRADAPHFLQYLRELTQAERPHIDVWILSHPHDDHIDAFMEIMANHSDALTVGEIRLNFPSREYVAPDESAYQTMKEFYEVLPRFADKVRFCSAGDDWTVGEARFRFLYSPEADITTNHCNNASLVFRMDLGGKSALFTGDCGIEAGRKIVQRYRGSGLLKADICQMAHHGQCGCDRAFYEAVSPEICLWCTPLWLWNNDNGKGYNTHNRQTVIVRGWMDELGVKTHYKTADGIQICPLGDGK